VQESKDNTNRLLDEFKKSGSLPEESALVAQDGLTVYGLSGAQAAAATSPSEASLSSLLTEFFSNVKAGDYVALLAYIQETKAHDALLQSIRTYLRDRLRVATTTGYGPRFLHSTGQLHKGGSDEGVFLQLTDEDRTDLSIPGEPYTFSTLKEAQAMGDFSSLAKRNRRAVRLHLGKNTEEGLRKLEELIRAATSVEAQSSSA
jgi:hypothetical protein